MILTSLHSTRGWPYALRRTACMLLAAIVLPAFADTKLADQPLFTNTGVPGNLALSLSVEYPTAVSVAHPDSTYSTDTAMPYLGYFDPHKCYEYVYVASPTNTNLSHFKPVGQATKRICSGSWSGNFLNWATMQTIDPFRWALTGGYRVVDQKDLTIIEKAYASGQGGTSNFPNRTLSGSALVSGATPWSATEFRMRVYGLGSKLRFTVRGDPNSASTEWDGARNIAKGNARDEVFELHVRVKVCDAAAGLESNCKRYPSGYWKPEGLIQQYAERIRLSAFGYLNDATLFRDGGVLRARQKFVGPEIVVPGQPNKTNPASEWDSETGIFKLNPDSEDAANTAVLFGVPVSNSGVINYLNKFGASGSYKSYDPVGELYYAALRYFRHLGNVDAYSSPGNADTDTKVKWVDGFPVITKWDDPIQYTCQKNFVLGIGDVNTHADKNLPGTTSTLSEPTKPIEVASDKTVDAVKATNKVGELEGLGSSLASVIPYNGCCNNNSALMAGLAYDANTTDIRPDLPNPVTMPRGQSVKTYWLDVLEYQTYKSNNQFYLAAKYGGFDVPRDFSPYTYGKPLEPSWWRKNGDMVGGQPRPDNYFIASRPDQMVWGLTQAFADIAAQLTEYTTSFATPAAKVDDDAGVATFGARYNALNWTGEVDAGLLKFNSPDVNTIEKKWSLTDKLESQFAGAGWSSDTSATNGRRVVTWNYATGHAVPFRYADISDAQRKALDASYRDGNDGADLLNYLRGDRSQEMLPGTSGRPYRYRQELLGDIVGSKLTVVAPPNLNLSANPGYDDFKSRWKSRPTVVYFGANDGMLHAIDGSIVETKDASGKKAFEFGPSAGKEIFAYVPGSLFQGAGGTPDIDGLAGLGRPGYSHRYYVNATPTSYDIDFNWTYEGNALNPNARKSPDWHTVLIGGLGKGGRSYYAIDVTDPGAMTSESAVAAKVLWEFADEDMGYTFGEPSVIKTEKYGWVVMLPSGYNNKTGKGYFFVVHPVTGKLLEKVSTGEGSAATDAGLAHVNAFTRDLSEGTADAAYGVDLFGNVWRWDLRGAPQNYPAPEKIAQLTDDKGKGQPITSRPMIEFSPKWGTRHVLVGTGRLLHTGDILSGQMQAIYSILDGKLNEFETKGPFPRTRSSFTLVTDFENGLKSPANWYVELGTKEVASSVGATSTIGSRVIDVAKAWRNTDGVIFFASVLPNGDVCEPDGSSDVYARKIATGESVLEAGASQSIPGMVTDMKLFFANGKTRSLVLTNKGERVEAPTKPSTTNAKSTNWREIPVVD